MPIFPLQVLLAVLMLFSLPARAQVMSLDPALQAVPLGTYLSYWQDADGDAGLARVQAVQDWMPVSGDVADFGLDDGTYWFRLELQVANPDELWLLVTRNPLLDDVDFYLVDDGGRLLEQHQAGFMRPRQSSGIVHRFFVFPVMVHHQGVVTAYFRVRSRHGMQFPLQLWQTRDFARHDEASNLVLGIFFGVLGILLLYNFFLYTLVRDRLHLLFSAMAAVVLLFQIQITGLGLRFLWPLHVQWNSALLLINGMFTTFFVVLFADHFLQLERRRFPLLTALRTMRWLCLFAALTAFWLQSDIGIYLLLMLGAVTLALTSYGVIYCFRSDDRPLKMFALGWFVLVSGVSLFIAGRTEMLPYDFLTEYGISISTFIELVLFSMALGDRHQRENESRTRHFDYQLRLLADERTDLEKQVSGLELQRTAQEVSLRLQEEGNERIQLEIEGRETEIERTHQQLRNLSRIDVQTGAYNRTYFNQCLKEEYERAARGRQSLGLVLVQLDQYGELADQLGIRASDDILYQTAECIDGVIRHHCASLFRYEDGMFAVLLPTLSLERGRAIAEMIRSAFLHQPFLHAGKLLQITLSLGVASVPAVPGGRPETLTQLADQALLSAREQGCDCVQVAEQKVG